MSLQTISKWANDWSDYLSRWKWFNQVTCSQKRKQTEVTVSFFLVTKYTVLPYWKASRLEFGLHGQGWSHFKTKSEIKPTHFALTCLWTFTALIWFTEEREFGSTWKVYPRLSLQCKGTFMVLDLLLKL